MVDFNDLSDDALRSIALHLDTKDLVRFSSCSHSTYSACESFNPSKVFEAVSPERQEAILAALGNLKKHVGGCKVLSDIHRDSGWFCDSDSKLEFETDTYSITAKFYVTNGQFFPMFLHKLEFYTRETSASVTATFTSEDDHAPLSYIAVGSCETIQDFAFVVDALRVLWAYDNDPFTRVGPPPLRYEGLAERVTYTGTPFGAKMMAMLQAEIWKTEGAARKATFMKAVHEEKLTWLDDIADVLYSGRSMLYDCYRDEMAAEDTEYGRFWTYEHPHFWTQLGEGYYDDILYLPEIFISLPSEFPVERRAAHDLEFNRMICYGDDQDEMLHHFGMRVSGMEDFLNNVPSGITMHLVGTRVLTVHDAAYAVAVVEAMGRVSKHKMPKPVLDDDESSSEAAEALIELLCSELCDCFFNEFVRT